MVAAPAASQLKDLEPNVVYLTFNQPEKNEYVGHFNLPSAGNEYRVSGLIQGYST